MVKKKIVFASSDFDFGDVPDLFTGRTGSIAEVVKSGKGLLEKINREHPDLLVIDRDLDEMTGDEISFTVKNETETRQIPIIILVPDEKSEIMERCLLSGCDDYVLKPVDGQILMSKMARLLNLPFRRDLRILFRFWLQGRTLSSYFFGNSKDISAGGMLFSTDIDLKIGDIIEITFFIPASTRKVSATCKIVRVVGQQDEFGHQYGVQFLQMEDWSRINLEDYLLKMKAKS